MDRLVKTHKDCEVLALTGDCASLLTSRVSEDWNRWPQYYKFCVPGNHDSANTFIHLDRWHHNTPWIKRVKTLTFIGIDTSAGFGSVEDQIESLNYLVVRNCRGLVVLSHQWPKNKDVDMMCNILKKLTRGRKILFLHGHEHPSDFNGSAWYPNAKLNNIECCRSHVYSGVNNSRKGMGHSITWNPSEWTFDCVVVVP